MKKKLLLLLAFVVLGVLQAVIFMLAYSDRFEAYSFAQCLLALIYAVPQSLMVASWVMLPAFVVGFVYVWIRGDWHRRFMIGYLTFVMVPLLVLCCLDWVLYGYWGFRLDVTPFIYVLDDPLEAAKESPWWAFPLTLGVVGLVTWGFNALMRLVYPPRRSGSITRMNTGAAQQREGLCNLLLCVLTAIVGSGCFGLMGIGSSYHSDQSRLNHAATSPIYSFFYSVGQQRTPMSGQYRFMTDDERLAALTELDALAQRMADATLADSLTGPMLAQRLDTLQTLVDPKANVLVLLLESFSGSACSYLNPEADPTVMPSVSRAMSEGIAFTQCYANSFRTERGLISVLSAFPGQPTYSVITDRRRLASLPSLTRPFAEAGYSLEFITGGDGSFCNLPEYLATSGFTATTDRKQFPSEAYDCQWGLHDGQMYPYLLDRLQQEWIEANDSASTSDDATRPYLKVFLSLSSHEPFDVPMQRCADPYLNSVAYADSCLGAFLDELRADTLLWNHLLVIGLPDHGYANYPDGIDQHSPERYHIPMFWTGGAVRGHIDVDTYCQQTDLAATLLRRLGLTADGLAYSHDVFDARSPHFAFYAWPDGFGFLTDSCRYLQSNHDDGHPLPGSDDPQGLAERFGKAYLQTIYDNLAGMTE